MKPAAWLGMMFVLSSKAFACFCFAPPMCSKIESLPDSSAVFVGRVVDVWPSRSTLAIQSKNLSLAALRRSILRRWRDALSPEEERDVRTNVDRTAIELRYGLLQRVRFEVTEVLVGPEIREVFTDATSCGYPFRQGRVYLVNTSRDGTRYKTGACMRTSSIASDEASEDLKALRAWKSEKPLPPRIYGRIDRDELRSGIRVTLRHGVDEQVIQIGSDGYFSFDGLKKDVYQLQVEDERGSGARIIDLFRAACFEAHPWYSDGWRIAGLPVVMDDNPPLEPNPLHPGPLGK